MKKFKAAFICFCVFVAGTVYAASLTDKVKSASVENYAVKVGAAFEAAFDNPTWAEQGGKVVFTGKVKAGSVFPAAEKDSFFDMQYSTIEENQMKGGADELYNKYIKDMPQADREKSGYNNKMLLDSEKYYNILEILDTKAAGGTVKAEIALSKDGKTAEIASFNAPTLYTHNGSIKDFIKFVFKK